MGIAFRACGVGEGVWYEEGVAVYFGKVAAFDVGEQIQVLDDLFCGGGFGCVGGKGEGGG